MLTCIKHATPSTNAHAFIVYDLESLHNRLQTIEFRYLPDIVFVRGDLGGITEHPFWQFMGYDAEKVEQLFNL